MKEKVVKTRTDVYQEESVVNSLMKLVLMEVALVEDQ